jgi:ubiquinone biosynthesis protein Coq4
MVNEIGKNVENDIAKNQEIYERYMNDGYVQPVSSTSALASSSRWLNHYYVREWIQRECLRRNGLDLPGTYGIPELNRAIEDIQDGEKISAMLDEAAADWPELAQFLSDRYMSYWTTEDLRKCPEGSFGNMVFRHYDKYGYDNKMSSIAFPVRNHYEYFRRRKTEIHDFMHILTGAGFDYIGEAMPNMIHFGSFYKYFKPELAMELCSSNMLLFWPYLFRTSLNYGEGFPWVWDLMDKGYRIGQQSGPYFLKRIEDYLDLPVEEVRAKLEIKGAYDLDFEEWKRRSDIVMEGGQTKTEKMALERRERARLDEKLLTAAAE